MTDKQKLDGYLYAIKELKDKRNEGFGICTILICYLKDNNLRKINTSVLNYFQELIKYKPERIRIQNHWFGTSEERIEVLNKIIAELEK